MGVSVSVVSYGRVARRDNADHEDRKTGWRTIEPDNPLSLQVLDALGVHGDSSE